MKGKNWRDDRPAAIKTLEEELKHALKPLKMKLECLSKVKHSYDQAGEHIKNQAKQTENEIKQEFEKLHRFLWDEEAARIATLKEEAREKTRALEHSIEDIVKAQASLCETIEGIEQEMEMKNISFLQNFTNLK